MSIWKNKDAQASKEDEKSNRTPIYEMSPSERSDAQSNYEEWVENTMARAELTLSKMVDAGYITSEMSIDIIGRIEKYFIEVEFSGIYINKVENLENRLFEGIVTDVEKDSGLGIGISSIREAVYKASKYKAQIFKIEAINFKEAKKAKEANNPKTILEDHLEEEDTSDKEVTSSRGKKGKKGKKGKGK